MDNFKMDRNVVSNLTFEEADNHTAFYKDKTPLQRLMHACFIINNIYNVKPTTKINRKITFARKNE